MVKRVLRTEVMPLGVKFCIDQPKNHQMLVDDNLIIAGWIVGETDFADKIIISGGINTEIPVNVHRPDVHLHFGNGSENLCPLIDGIPRYGFSKQIPLGPLYAGAPIEVAVELQNGGKIPLAIISFSKGNIKSKNVPPSEGSTPKAIATTLQPKPDMRFYYFGHEDAGFFLHSCHLLSRAYPSSEWPDLTAAPLPNEKELSIQHYDIFIPVHNHHRFMDESLSVIKRLPKYVIEDLNNKRCSLILDRSTESGGWGLCAFIRNELRNQGLHDFSNVMLIAQNRLLGDITADFCFYPFDYYVVESAIALHAQMDDMWNDRLHNAWKSGKVNNILCLNATPRRHRWLTVAALIKKGMLANSLISFSGDFSTKDAGVEIQDVLDFAAKTAGLENLNDAIHWLVQNAPLKVDEFTEKGTELAFKVDLSVYEKTIISIITETGVDNMAQRITEKSFKAFAIGHPSVVISHPNTIEAVEELGFDVFHDFIDHSYDQIDNWVLRMNTAIAEAISFCEAWRSGSVDVDKLQAISQKNRDWLREGFFERYSKHYAFPILSLLASKY